MHSANIKTLGKEPIFGSEAEKLWPVKLHDGSVTFNRVGDPNRSVSDGLDRTTASVLSGDVVLSVSPLLVQGSFIEISFYKFWCRYYLHRTFSP